MKWARLFLVVEGLLFVVSGAWALLAPLKRGNDLGLTFTSPTGTVDHMAIFGGLTLGIGAFLVWSAVRKAYLPAGLLALVFGVGAAGLARALALATQGPVVPLQVAWLAFELGTAVLAALLLRYVLRQARLG